VKEWFGSKAPFSMVGLELHRKKGQEFKAAPMWDRLFTECVPTIDTCVVKKVPYYGIYFEEGDGWTYIVGKEIERDCFDRSRMKHGLVIRDFAGFDFVGLSRENADIKGLIEHCYSKWTPPKDCVRTKLPVIFIEVFREEGRIAEIWIPVKRF
jgi:predicted transcriptional regulator YdeE